MREFELGIILRYAEMGTAGASPKAEWIRGHLMSVGSDYAYNMWKRYREFVEAARLMGAMIRPCNYQSFARYVNLLKKLGLIRLAETKPSRPRSRAYYELNPDKIDSPEWGHPYQALYPITQTSYRRIRGLPVKTKALKTRRPRGRPRRTA